MLKTAFVPSSFALFVLGLQCADRHNTDLQTPALLLF